MFLERIKAEGLAHNSWFIADGADAVVIDPRRDFDVYLELARRQRARIRYVLETHRNEDYVIGSAGIAAATGARILHSSRLAFEYGEPVSDGDAFGVGTLRFRVLETPGHTDESLSFALIDESSGDGAVMAFSGDALFIGDVGRTDLYGPDEARRLAETLHRSLFDKLLALGDWVILAPAHGSGSVCGGAISDRDQSTLGYERRHNPLLQLREREAFVQRKLGEKHVRPPYFRLMEEANLRAHLPVAAAPAAPVPLAPDELAARMRAGAVLLDMRTPQAFAGGHVPGAYNVWLGGAAIYVPWVARPEQELLLALPEEASVDEVTRILYRMGFDRIGGYLRGGFDAWQNEGREVERLGTVDTAELKSRLARGERLEVLDVRKPDEWEEGTVPGARKLFVGELEARVGELPRDRLLVTMCSVGHRGGIAASILARAGFRQVANYLGGFKAWKQRQP